MSLSTFFSILSFDQSIPDKVAVADALPKLPDTVPLPTDSDVIVAVHTAVLLSALMKLVVS